MSFNRIDIFNFRNLSRIKISPSPRFNVIYGENSSGKTSLLEAIYYLGFGRSFRTRYFEQLIQHEQERFLIVSHFDSTVLGLERYRNGDYRIRSQKQNFHSITEFAKLLPLQLINHDTYQLVIGSPQVRREFIDWGVFHVKHNDFFPIWKRFIELLKQRNAALKIRPVSKDQIILWDKELVQMAQLIHQYRSDYLREFEPFLKKVATLFLGNTISLELAYYPGWNTQKPLSELSSELLNKEINLGYTLWGPHRADLKIYIYQSSAVEVLSRGQQKMFACAMRFAQSLLLEQQTHKKSIFLIDDLPAELDEKRVSMLANFLKELNDQVFLTSTQSQLFHELCQEGSLKKFHVEQGVIQEEN